MGLVGGSRSQVWAFKGFTWSQVPSPQSVSYLPWGEEPLPYAFTIMMLPPSSNPELTWPLWSTETSEHLEQTVSFLFWGSLCQAFCHRDRRCD